MLERQSLQQMVLENWTATYMSKNEIRSVLNFQHKKKLKMD